MAGNTEAQTQAGAGAAGGGGGSSLFDFILMAIVGIACGVAGVFVPRLVMGTGKGDQEPQEARVEEKPKEETKVAFVPFGDVVVNLNEPRLNRYVRVNISLEVAESDLAEVTAAVEQNKPLLRNWLIAYLSDKQLDEIRGAVGLNRLRREIRDAFNRLLFDGDEEKIRGVLLEEFNIQ